MINSFTFWVQKFYFILFCFLLFYFIVYFISFYLIWLLCQYVFAITSTLMLKFQILSINENPTISMDYATVKKRLASCKYWSKEYSLLFFDFYFHFYFYFYFYFNFNFKFISISRFIFILTLILVFTFILFSSYFQLASPPFISFVLLFFNSLFFILLFSFLVSLNDINFTFSFLYVHFYYHFFSFLLYYSWLAIGSGSGNAFEARAKAYHSFFIIPARWGY